MRHTDQIIRIFAVGGGCYNDHWNVEGLWHGEPRIVYSNKSIYKALKWAKEHGYYEKGTAE